MGLLTSFAQEAVPTVTSVNVETTTSAGIFAGTWLLFYLILVVLLIVAYWKIFTKAGEAGWKSIIPIWNVIVLLKIVGRPWWWLLLLFIPFVNFIILIIVALDLGKSFGKSTVFSIFGLIIFSVVGYLILGFGDAKYVGPAAGSTPAAPAAPAAA
jgi:Family of unknown function (DUF5684)